MASQLILVVVGLFLFARLQGTASYTYQLVRTGKHAAVVISYKTWQGAKYACESDRSDATLFSVENSTDSTWLGQRINYEKDDESGSSKFWVGLKSFGGSRTWLTGGSYVHYSNVVQIAGDDASDKNYAWAVPDSGIKIKYEFKTTSDQAEAFICQYWD